MNKKTYLKPSMRALRINETLMAASGEKRQVNIGSSQETITVTDDAFWSKQSNGWDDEEEYEE